LSSESVVPQNFTLPLLPSKPLFLNEATQTIGPFDPSISQSLDLPAICLFCATGFFFGDQTYFQQVRGLRPGHTYTLKDGQWHAQVVHHWQYRPRELTLAQASAEFGNLFESIVRRDSAHYPLVLPLSGGLDSRTLAAALPSGGPVHSFSYAFAGGLDETAFGKAIARLRAWPFHAFTIRPGSLWAVLDEAATINGCLAEFTHPRQLSILPWLKNIGTPESGVLLGHWGDVLFDSPKVDPSLSLDDQVTYLKKTIIKRGALPLAEALWRHWGLGDSCERHLEDELRRQLKAIDISHASARLRAFKSLNWAHRWTTTNLQFFSAAGSLILPYYDEALCDWVGTVPEHLLADRQIQIDYLKTRAPELAKVPWQSVAPYHLFNAQRVHTPAARARRLKGKVGRRLKKALGGDELIQRNWELQFRGLANRERLHDQLELLNGWSFWDPALTRQVVKEFEEEDALQNAHSLSMLLTLSRFCAIQTQNFPAQ
jgi:hypothetical protein